MVSRKSGEPSPESIARANRLKIAAEDGKKALVDVERQAIAVRRNMARLRTLREAEEARQIEEKRNQPDAPLAKKKRKKSASRHVIE
ncbi:transcriptional regulator [Bradyrhizobium sp. CB3481]|uniref:transcriptional regulator n=1 Tax=Bradyrhizobium sp. CB3481 TaxID=3039158 RepID=UPI0024B267E1|nr:transcriptional regulator [Bradyrhizobium sp. CB3481]WFU19979.1 transcriptional regulator [Bradyrhizobium sp. CB3481]